MFPKYAEFGTLLIILLTIEPSKPLSNIDCSPPQSPEHGVIERVNAISDGTLELVSVDDIKIVGPPIENARRSTKN